MKRVKLTCNWCTDEDLFNRCERVYKSNYNNLNIVFTSEQDYDYLVIINDIRTSTSHPIEKTIGVIMEPSWATNFRGNLKRRCKYILSHERNGSSSQYIYYPGTLPPHFDYNEGNNLDYYINNNFKKTKKCSVITSFANHQPNEQTLYHKRVEFVKKLLQADIDIDVYGNNWEHSGIEDSRIKGTLQNKKDGLLPYEFSIAIENSVEEDYFTEKLTDCILTDTTPIYYGCPNIDRFFEGVYELSNLDDVSIITKIIKELPSNQSTNKKLLATKFNLYVAIDKLISKL